MHACVLCAKFQNSHEAHDLTIRNIESPKHFLHFVMTSLLLALFTISYFKSTENENRLSNRESLNILNLFLNLYLFITASWTGGHGEQARG